MNETIIQEIANQLGIAVDQAGLFISENLPAYAELKAMQGTSVLVAFWVSVLALATIALVSLILTTILRKKNIREAEDNYDLYAAKDWFDYTTFKVFYVALILCVPVLISSLIATAAIVPEIIGWNDYPEAMLIDKAIETIN